MWDYDFDIEVENHDQYIMLIRDIKNQFGDILLDVEPIQYFYEFGLNYAPYTRTDR